MKGLELLESLFCTGLAFYLILRYYYEVHVISRKALFDFWRKHPSSKTSFERWFKLMTKTDFNSFNELRVTFPSADKVGELVVFNIGGNTYRLIASIHFNRKKVYVRHVLTYEMYDKGAWKK